MLLPRNLNYFPVSLLIRALILREKKNRKKNRHKVQGHWKLSIPVTIGNNINTSNSTVLVQIWDGLNEAVTQSVA